MLDPDLFAKNLRIARRGAAEFTVTPNFGSRAISCSNVGDTFLPRLLGTPVATMILSKSSSAAARQARCSVAAHSCSP